MTPIEIIAIIAGGVSLYSTGWFFSAKANKFAEDKEWLYAAALTGLFVIPIAVWYGGVRPTKSARMEEITKELEKRAQLIERMEVAVRRISPERWQVVRAEHLEEIVNKLSK